MIAIQLLELLIQAATAVQGQINDLPGCLLGLQLLQELHSVGCEIIRVAGADDQLLRLATRQHVTVDE